MPFGPRAASISVRTTAGCENAANIGGIEFLRSTRGTTDAGVLSSPCVCRALVSPQPDVALRIVSVLEAMNDGNDSNTASR